MIDLGKISPSIREMILLTGNWPEIGNWIEHLCDSTPSPFFGIGMAEISLVPIPFS
jgi:hypothetical protein|uniref:Uncharacterized protein n=1 Tax=Picea glauca TaxID=3330 RepID=A0A101M2B9_PICGL|nr:hypothetical protein ABT39_MTgene2815 [Picea glauca]